MNWITDGITAPKGFSATGIHCGIKRKNKDLTMLFSERPCSYAGVFTKNIVKAAPVNWNMELLKQKKAIQGIIINSGNANACTGRKGYEDTKTMAKVYGDKMGIDQESVLVASTGVIGQPLPMDIIHQGIDEIVKHYGNSRQHATAAAEGIMTTDTFLKEKCLQIKVDGKIITISGMAKGSGMIHPNMGTMLSFITTDANIDQDTLQTLLKETISDTYNMISVDGDTSTNDMVLVLANGMASNTPIQKDTEDYAIFREAFYMLNQELAKLIVKDGEGATKFIEVTVKNMHDKEEARKMTHAVITSNLVKTAFFGEDANWGRILCALGYSGAEFDPNLVDVDYVSPAGTIKLLEQGQPIGFDEEYALEILKEKEIKVVVDCHQGEAEVTGWGCDLSYEYVKINGEYRT
jgi:glutamate N-acetyltransferase/amino-acid N-acetyltransferase